MIRLAVPSIDEDDIQAVTNVIRSGYLVQGPKVEEFEREVADYIGTKHAIAVANCTAALHLALVVLGVKSGDKVAVTTYSWPATANVIEICGAEPVFVEIDPYTFNMCPVSLKNTLDKNTIKAILPVHTFGGMADMAQIEAVSVSSGIPILEDAACALGSQQRGKMAGSWGTIGCFSFHPRKAITTGEGGMITTDDDRLAFELKALRNHGLNPNTVMPEFVLAGYNLRLTEFQAALGISQMKKLDRILQSRIDSAYRYEMLFKGSQVKTPKLVPGSKHVYQSYVVLIPETVAPKRASLISSLRDKRIEATIGTYNMPRIKYYREKYPYNDGLFPITDSISSTAVSLPLYENMELSDQEMVVEALLAEIERLS